MRSTRRNVVIAAAAAIALTLATATPALAATVSGTRSCTAPKSVTVWSVTQGTSGYHKYTANNQKVPFLNPNPSVAYFFQSYGAPVSSGWIIYSDGTINNYSAGCD